jgi:hypothetical protein
LLIWQKTLASHRRVNESCARDANVLTLSLRGGTKANRHDDTPMAARNVIGRQPASGVRIVLPHPR